MQQCVSALVRRREWVPLNDPQAKQGPALQRFDCLLKDRAPITWPALCHTKNKSPQINIHRTGSGNENKEKQLDLFEYLPLFPPQHQSLYIWQNPNTFGKPRSVCWLTHKVGGILVMNSFFFFSFMSLHVDFQSEQCCWRSHASFSVAGVLLTVTVESGLPLIRSSSAWTSVKSRFCPWKKEEKENTE